MNNYRSYKETDEVYISAEFGFPIALILITGFITYGLLYFFGVITAVLANVFISWVCYFFVYYYGKSDTSITFDFLKGVAIILLILLFVDYGVYLLVVYQKTGIFNKLYFQIWLGILFGPPILYYAFQYIRYYVELQYMANNYLKVLLIVNHDRELLSYIDVIQFVNTSRHTISDIKLKQPPCFYSEKELSEMNQRVRNNYLAASVFSERVHMPFDANFLYMSWYSVIEDNYYDIEIPFPFERLIIEKEKYPTDVPKILRGKKTKTMNLHIHTNGGIRLFNEDLVLIDLPFSTPKNVTEDLKKQKASQQRQSHEYYSNPEAFSGLIKKIRNSGGIEERFLIQQKQFCWSISISGLKGNNYMEVFDVAFKNWKTEFTEIEIPQINFLPQKLKIVYRGYHLYPWLTLHINTQKMYHSIQKLTEGNTELPVLFDVVFENSSETDLKFRIVAGEISLVFDDCEIEMDKDHKQSMDDHLQDLNEDQQKRGLYKEGWDLVFDKKYDLAQEKCNTIKTIDPGYGFAYFLEARILWYKEGFEACLSKKDYFIAKTQHEPAALAHMYNNYGCLYDQESRYDESLSYFEKAILSNPKEGMYVCNLAEIYCKLNNPKKALQTAEKSKELGHESSTLNAILESKGKRYV